jgi:hypothetical protein
MGTFQVVIPAQAGIHDKYWIPDQVRNDRCSFPESRHATCLMLSLVTNQLINVFNVTPAAARRGASCDGCEFARAVSP